MMLYIRPINNLRSNEITTLYKDAMPYIMSDTGNEIDFIVVKEIINRMKG